MKFAFLFFFLIFSSSSLQLSGREITYRLTVLSQNESGSNELVNQPGGEVIHIIPGFTSQKIKISIGKNSLLYFFEKDATTESKPLYKIPIPEDASNDLLVLFFTSKDKLKPELLDLKKLNIPKGGQYFFNFMKKPILVRCGEKSKPIQVNAKSRKIIPAPQEKKVIQEIYYPDKKTKKPKKFSSSIHISDSTERILAFCYEQKGRSRPKIIRISIYDRKFAEESSE